MPIYEYRCDKCGHQFDFLARTQADKPQKCDKCGAKQLRKQFSSFAAVSGGAGSAASCSTGSCGTAPCATGACPFA